MDAGSHLTGSASFFNHIFDAVSSMHGMTILEKILHHRIVCILRGGDTNKVLKIVEALYEGGVRAVEVTMNSPQPLASIKNLSKIFDDMLIGAGTVLDTAMAKDAINAGAKFIISPTTDEDTVKYTKAHNVVSIPGAYTATEILNAFQLGGDIIKVFPARGSADYIKDLHAPLPHIPLMPTGGVTVENIGSFNKAGAVAFGIGSSLVDMKKDLNQLSLKEITIAAQRFINALKQ